MAQARARLGMRTRRLFGMIAATALLALALAGCGGGGATATTAPGSSSGSSTTVAASPAAPTTPAATTGATTAPATTAPTQARATASATAPATASRAGGGTATASGNATRYTIVPEASKASYRVDETLIFRNNQFNTAVGSTSAFTGDIFIDKTKPSASTIGPITVDISKLTSDSSQRDNMIRQRWLESNKYPNVTFVAKRLEGLPDAPYTDGQELTFKIIGDLTVRTTTKEVTFDTKAKIIGDTLTGTATTAIQMTDFSFDPPAIANIVTAENGVKFILDLTAKRAS